MSTADRDRSAWLSAVSEALSEALPRLHGAPPEPRIAELIAALTAALARGELEIALQGPAPPEVAAAHWPGGHLRALEASSLAGDPQGPLVLQEGRLSWRRWHEQRQDVLEELIRRAAPTPTGAAGDTDSPALQPRSDGGAPPWDPQQRRAVAAVLRHGLVLLEGGPGTGKTTTVAAMLRTLGEHDPQARIHLAAPTGKAAARLRQATGASLPCTTLHRLLESRGEHFGRNRHHRLVLDLLVVDELSMVDLALMQALLDALPPSCRLVLVGDPAQLPPIAPGAVMPELQRPSLRRALGGAAITLDTTYRNAGAIAAVAADLRRVINGDGAPQRDPLAVIRPRLSRLEPSDNLRWIEASPLQLPPAALAALEGQRQELARLAEAHARRNEGREDGEAEDGEMDRGAEGADALLVARDRLLVLSPLRRGRWGLEAIHRALLGEAVAGPLVGWPAGTPVLCSRNLPELGLANGDVGVLVGSVRAPAQRRLLFGIPGAAPLQVHPAQLGGAAEPALALTVHKAQGSEAEEVIVLLPGGEPVDARLLYTALTRARQRALLITPRPCDP